jgi:hypothetical protein
MFVLYLLLHISREWVSSFICVNDLICVDLIYLAHRQGVLVHVVQLLYLHHLILGEDSPTSKLYQKQNYVLEGDYAILRTSDRVVDEPVTGLGLIIRNTCNTRKLKSKKLG